MSHICIGAKGSGKTHLLNSLRDEDSINETSHSVSTVGTNIYTIKNPHVKDVELSNKQKARQMISVQVREIGGTMAPIWRRYFEGVTHVIYVLDTSNLCQISGAGVLLYTVLTEPRLQTADILLVLTKMDLAYRQMRNEALLMIQLAKLRKELRQRITVVETSAVTKNGLNDVLDWLFLPPKKASQVKALEAH
ncbi:ADP-ribosylation factor-like protein 16 [Lutzomyia longipalpis]|uniref:Putative gtp-binding adp-ribosylation factor-like protein arl1 n=1 Tax=Lutzomyia longipalpis TaxID=7200 RepID=A0A1B0CL06_LUTLO|nr:ADP-ribosylation factor-like protein 16 [Lutzomyia longipalpis]